MSQQQAAAAAAALADSQATTTSTSTSTAASMPRDKFRSPPPPAERMTPPPSSQAPVLAESRNAARTPTPTHSHLSSPPPTIRRSRIVDGDGALASREELQEILGLKEDELRRANATIAAQAMQLHYMQEDHENKSVELHMQARDMALLHEQMQSSSADKRADEHQSQLAAELEQINALRTRLEDLELHNEDLQRELADLTAAKQRVDERCDSLTDHCLLLRGRLEDKTDMIRMLRAQIQGSYGSAVSGSRRPPQTPQTKPRGNAFDQLLLADKMLSSQPSATTPSTPQPRQHKRAHGGHRRASQSLSSLPSTPLHARTMPPLQRTHHHLPQPGPLSSPIRAPETPTRAPAGMRRRMSRDSTISASGSDAERRPRFSPISQPRDNAAVESRASQQAASLLRQSTSGSFHSSAGNADSFTSNGAAPSMKQAKLFGQITKPASSGFDAESPSAKKRRVQEGVGLGIGNWAETR